MGWDEPCLPITFTGYVVSPQFLIDYYKTEVLKRPNRKIHVLSVDSSLSEASKSISDKTGLCLWTVFRWQDQKYILGVCGDNPNPVYGPWLNRSHFECDAEWAKRLVDLMQLLVDEGAIGKNEEMVEYTWEAEDSEKENASRCEVWYQLAGFTGGNSEKHKERW
ncbi:hypothetical protein SISSUDRAFT_1053210 [Sistotremastrum suecicum HHB10207 ss-3]|uniref:Uncharacterized protein n=1 Tax=Sistotremastrum suecicum HHB10207 ss-3 TaxID=1314776 RepID=A0A165ZC51_9AGAM|nr:hypothetical protein SISSUDRAFT_1053210 [Sistotremastrum suecicum HHB10207 ss-3]